MKFRLVIALKNNLFLCFSGPHPRSERARTGTLPLHTSSSNRSGDDSVVLNILYFYYHTYFTVQFSTCLKFKKLAHQKLTEPVSVNIIQIRIRKDHQVANSDPDPTLKT